MNLPDQGVSAVPVVAASVNVPDSVTANSAQTTDYVPVAGDVVEFDFSGHNKGIVFQYATLGLRVATSCGEGGYDAEVMRNVVKLGHVDGMDSIYSWTEAREIAKAYFSKPVFKVGDLILGDLVKIAVDNGKELTGVVVDGRSSFDHGKVVILLECDNHYAKWGNYTSKPKITSIIALLGNVSTGQDYMSDDAARCLLKKYLAS